MILNVSGRTDIIAFYSKWFINRLHAGYVDVANPICPTLISRIYFEDVDAFVFCTKNPLPIIPYLKEIKKPILFQITVTPYKKDIEPNVPTKKEIIKSIRDIVKIVGKENVYVRYDPIFINENYPLEYHLKAFEKLCKLLDQQIQGFIISFLDDYKNVQKNYHILRPKIWQKEDYEKLGRFFSLVAQEHGMTVQTCAEKIDLTEYGFIKSDCLTVDIAKRLTHQEKFKKWQARNKKCNCVEMVDIGAYNTCNHRCKYCYANFDEEKIKDNILNHDDNSSLLIGKITDKCKIKIRK